MRNFFEKICEENLRTKRGSTCHASDDGKCLVLALPDMHHDFMSGLSERLRGSTPAAKNNTFFLLLLKQAHVSDGLRRRFFCAQEKSPLPCTSGTSSFLDLLDIA